MVSISLHIRMTVCEASFKDDFWIPGKCALRCV